MVDNKLENAINKYKALRGKEKQKFNERHYEAEKLLDERYNHSNSIEVKLKKITLHIFGESFYKLNCLRILKSDTPKKYLVRNRQIASLVLAGSIVGTAIGLANLRHDEPKPDPIVNNKPEIEYCDINRVYEVQFGDTLSEVAEEFDVSQSSIKYANKKDSTLLYTGEDLIIPYQLNTDYLDECTDVVNIGDMTVEELADKYETDCKTLVELNGDGITYDYTEAEREYKTDLDQLLVPDFDKVLEKHK